MRPTSCPVGWPAARSSASSARFPVARGHDGAVEVVVRPEAVELRPLDGAQAADVPARVVGSSFFGHDRVVRVVLASGREVQSRTPGYRAWRVGDLVDVVVHGPVSVVPTEHSPVATSV